MATTTVQVSHMQKVVDQDLEEKLGQNAILQAKQATDDEHAQTLMQALRENRKAVFWSVMISMSIIMEGYVLQPRSPDLRRLFPLTSSSV
jgi:SP family general alpha glucoside:H+ symporter-like MFS transporter